MRNTMHKVWIVYKWTMIGVVKPCVMTWIFVSGIPPAIRALASAVRLLCKAFGFAQ